MNHGRLALLACTLLVGSLLIPGAANAAAIQPHLPVGGLLDTLKDVVFDPTKIGVKFFVSIFTDLFAALADMLVPDSFAHKGVQFLQWEAAIPDYSDRAFADFHGMVRVSAAIGLAILPLTLVWAGAKSVFGMENSEPVHVIVLRTFVAIMLLLNWSALWREFAALTNSLTDVYLSQPAVIAGINKYMEIVVAGGILVSLPFLGILIFLLAAFLFLAGIVLKVGILLIGALLYATGPALLAAAPDRGGATLIKRYTGLLFAVFSLPVLFSLIYTGSALFIKDAGGIGSAIGGHSFFGNITGGIIAGFAAILGPLLCLAAAKRILGPALSVASSAVASFSPARFAGRAGASLSAARRGELGRAPGSLKTPPGATSPASAIERIAQSRIGARQAAGIGAAMAGVGGSTRQSPGRTALTAAQVATRGGLIGAAAMGAGYAGSGALIGRRPTLRNPLGDTANRPGAAATGRRVADAAAREALRPPGMRPASSVVTPREGTANATVRPTGPKQRPTFGAGTEPERPRPTPPLAKPAAPSPIVGGPRPRPGINPLYAPAISPDSTVRVPRPGAPSPARASSAPVGATPRPGTVRPDPAAPRPTPRPTRPTGAPERPSPVRPPECPTPPTPPTTENSP